MLVTGDLSLLERREPSVLTMGAFDGVHRGHQWLIRQVVNRARSLGALSVVISFDPRPEVTLRPGALQLSGPTEKARIMAALGVDVLVIQPFTPEFSQIPAGNFLASVLEHIALTEFWAGTDLAFGQGRGGSVDTLIAAGAHANFAVHVVPRQPLDGVPISSTLIRELVAAGDVAGAAYYLGHYASVSGPVVRGYGRGKDLGYPTANVQYSTWQLLPATGIYAAQVRADGLLLPAAVSVGYNPVFGNDTISVEAFILDWEGTVVGHEISIDFVARIREERNFPSLDALTAQITQDVADTRRILSAARQPGELLLSP